MEILNTLPGLKSANYVYSDLHSLLEKCDSVHSGFNIGKNGVNLTITCLSMNRISLTEKLIRSVLECIPNYQGKFLIIDNGSSANELALLADIIKEIPIDIKLVELGQNYGVSGGRNRTLEHVETEWVMFLDNDIFFINNPLPRLQNDISRLGCHFINMPLLDPDGETLFARGGNIFVSIEDNSIHIGAGSACVQEKVSHYDTECFLSTFLFGGASVMNLNTLKKMGGYDENMFIGFEDIDLSIRLFQAGMKVGTCGAISLIHDHPKPSSDDDIAYERTRFTRNILKKSADYLEQKHGMIFWSAPVDDWLEQKHSTLDVGTKGETVEVKDQLVNKPTFSPAKPKVALIIDTENWAFSNIANQLVNNLSASYEFSIIPTEIVENISQLLMMTKDYDITHFFWRESLRLIQDSYFESYNLQLGYTREQFYDAYLKERVITSSVYDHLFLTEAEITARNDFYNSLITAYTVSSSKLLDIYSSIPSYPKPLVLAEDGVDLTLFYPSNESRYKKIAERPLIIGWAGNSKWAGEQEDFKGYHSLLKPAVEMLQAEGLSIQLHLADRQLGFIPHKEMVKYYNQIDLYVCPSKIEGTPNPVLESMACGVPVISTDVGVVRDAFGPLQQHWILEERELSVLVNRLREFYHNREKLIPELSAENIESIKSWGWDVKAQNFKKFFDSVLAHRN